MAKSGPGKSFRVGLSDEEFFDLFPDDATAERWFVANRWANGIECAHCDSTDIEVGPKHPHMPYRCHTCHKYFSVKTNSIMHSSKLGYRKWALAIYIVTTNIKGISSMHLSRRLKVSQKTAWHLGHKIREQWVDDSDIFSKVRFIGPTEVDETYIGGKEANKHASKKLNAGRGTVGKTPVLGIKDRETNKVQVEVVESTDKATLQAFVEERTGWRATVYTDEARAYVGIPRIHETVKHSAGEYVRYEVPIPSAGDFVFGTVHTNGMESFWSMLKRGYVGIYHWMSAKHLHRYAAEFQGRHNHRPMDTLDQMSAIVRGMDGRRLRYVDITE